MNAMKSRHSEREDPQSELFKTELIRIIDLSHEMMKLADVID